MRAKKKGGNETVLFFRRSGWFLRRGKRGRARTRVRRRCLTDPRLEWLDGTLTGALAHHVLRAVAQEERKKQKGFEISRVELWEWREIRKAKKKGGSR